MRPGTDPISPRKRWKRKFTRREITEAQQFYEQEYQTHIAGRKKSQKTVLWFDWLWEYQQGQSFPYIAWRYQTTKSVIMNGVKNSQMRVELYFKTKEQNENN